MLYYFIINGREDIRARADGCLDAQLGLYDIQYRKYYTEGVGDGTRMVKMYCDLYPRDEVCFVACGGSGTVNEVASGLAGSSDKCMAILAFGETDDMIKYWPDRDFHDLGRLLSGESKKIDLIKAGNSYCFNVINVGFDAMVAYDALRLMDRGFSAVKAYRRAVFTGLLRYRSNGMVAVVDGVLHNRRNVMMCPMGNGQWCGGQFHCLPESVNDDGLIDVLVVRRMTLAVCIAFFLKYLKGEHLKSRFFRKRCKLMRAKNIQLRSKDLIYLCIDGEITASRSFDIEILPGELTIVLPAL